LENKYHRFFFTYNKITLLQQDLYLVTPMFLIEARCCRQYTVTTSKKADNASIFGVEIMKNAIIGKGNVGTALCNGLNKAGHETKFGHRDPSRTSH